MNGLGDVMLSEVRQAQKDTHCELASLRSLEESNSGRRRAEGWAPGEGAGGSGSNEVRSLVLPGRMVGIAAQQCEYFYDRWAVHLKMTTPANGTRVFPQ